MKIKSARAKSKRCFRGPGYRPLDSNLVRDTDKPMVRLGGRIGDEIRQLRKRKKLTLDQLSRSSGQSTGYLSQVERGISIPSVSAIYGIARALDVRVTWFFEASEIGACSDDGVVVRKDKRRRLAYATGIQDWLLSPRLNGPIEMFHSSFEPGSGSGDGWLTTSGHQAGLVTAGRLRLQLEATVYELSDGDSFAFDGRIRHKYSNPGSTVLQVLWIFSRPAD